MKTKFYGLLGLAALGVIVSIAHDQLLVEYGDDSAYWLASRTAAVAWIITLGILFALVDFVRWLRRTQPPKVFTGALALVVVSFLIGFVVARDWSFEWLVEQDNEVDFNRDEQLGVVVGIWLAAAVALVARWRLGRASSRQSEQLRSPEAPSHTV